MQSLRKAKLLLIISALLLPIYGFAADTNFSSTLNNQSKQNDPNGFSLVQAKVWSENGCVLNSGSKKINPGESTVLEIKQGCMWGGVSYKIISIKDNKDMGYLAHSFRNGSFSIEIKAPCKDSVCNFYDLNPQQDRAKS